MIKKTLLATAMLATTTSAVAEISANATLASDYVFRGLSQTDNQLAIQGGFDYAHESGVYVGTWASNVDSTFFGNGQDPQTEVDLYVGYASEYNDVGYDVGYLRYEYPGNGVTDTDEVYLSLSYMDFGLSFNYSDELSFLFSKESAWYIAASYDYALPYDVGLSLHVGHSTGDAFDKADGDGFGDSYTDWSIGVSKNWMGADFGLTYVDQNTDDADCDDSVSEWCDTKFVFSIGKSL